MSFIKLDRKLLKWEWFDDPNTTHLWIYILLRASYEDTSWHGIKCPKGSFITSLNRIASDTGLSVRNVRTCLKRLESTHEVTCKVTHQNTQIYVEKWEQYQCIESASDTRNDTQSDKRVTHKRHTSDTNKRNIRNKEIEEYIVSEEELKAKQNEVLNLFGRSNECN